MERDAILGVVDVQPTFMPGGGTTRDTARADFAAAGVRFRNSTDL